MAFPTDPNFIRSPRNSNRGSIIYIQWIQGPTINIENKLITLLCKVYYYDTNGNEINDPDPQFPSRWTRIITASNVRKVDTTNNGEVLQEITIDPTSILNNDNQIVGWNYTYNGVQYSIPNPDGSRAIIYLNKNNIMVNPDVVMGQYDFFIMIAQSQSVVLYQFLAGVVMNELVNYNTFFE